MTETYRCLLYSGLHKDFDARKCDTTDTFLAFLAVYTGTYAEEQYCKDPYSCMDGNFLAAQATTKVHDNYNHATSISYYKRTLLGTPNREPQEYSRNIMECKEPGRYNSIIYLLCSWGSLFGVPSRVPSY